MFSLTNIDIPVYSQRIVECCLSTHNPKDSELKITEPNAQLYTIQGLLIAKSVLDLQEPTQYILIANITSESKQISADEW